MYAQNRLTHAKVSSMHPYSVADVSHLAWHLSLTCAVVTGHVALWSLVMLLCADQCAYKALGITGTCLGVQW